MRFWLGQSGASRQFAHQRPNVVQKGFLDNPWALAELLRHGLGLGSHGRQGRQKGFHFVFSVTLAQPATGHRPAAKPATSPATPAKWNERKSACTKPARHRSTPSADTGSICPVWISATRNLGDRLTVGLRTLTPPVGVQIPLPQPIKRLFNLSDTRRAADSGLFLLEARQSGISQGLAVFQGIRNA